MMKKKTSSVLLSIGSSLVIFCTFYLLGFEHVEVQSNNAMFSSSPHRKLLSHAKVNTNRIWGSKCSKSDIIVSQGPTSPLPNGTPTYTVEIMNVCSNGCNISRIHLNCGWFSSARLINPRIFKRLRYDDCLVNNGKSLFNGGTLSFQYANTFPYKLTVSSVHC